ncbi:MAG: 50S ribosomal protein L18e [archaeon]|jgi:large subunit ribosomal protein L18e
MAKKLETIKLIASLEKAGRTTKKAMWKDLAERLGAPTRNNIAVNVSKLNYLAKQNKGKTLLVVGKVLSDGDLEEKVTVVAIAASETAKQKINANGKYIPLAEFAKDFAKVDLKKVVLIK